VQPSCPVIDTASYRRTPEGFGKGIERTCRIAAVIVAGASAGTCNNSLSPSTITHLEIAGAATPVKVDEQRALTAVLVKDGTQQPVQATWTMDASSSAQLSTNVVTALAPGLAHLRALFESYNSSADLQLVADYAGTWTGSYRVDTCDRLSGPGSSYCRFVLNSVFPLDLTLAQDGARVSGTTRFYSNGGRLLLAGSFAGTSDTAGNLSLTGTITSVDGSEQPETTTIADWRSSLSSNAEMTGAFVQHKQFTNAFGPQVSVEGCTLFRTQRHAPLVQ
jgi:hypothetical protein